MWNDYFCRFDYGSIYFYLRDLSFVYGNLGVLVIFVKIVFERLFKWFKCFVFLMEVVVEDSIVNDEIIYEVELFDEVVFVKVVYLYGYKFLSCSFEKVILYIFGEGLVIYEIL